MTVLSTVSEELKTIDYDPQSETLRVTFNNGERHDYYRVPEYTYKSLMSAPSKCCYHAANINNCFRFTKH